MSVRVQEIIIIKEPDPKIRDEFDKRLIASLLRFLNEVRINEGFADVPLPRIKLLTFKEFIDRVGLIAIALNAYYDRSVETIYLPYVSLEKVEWLLHEFYHHVQNKRFGESYFPPEELAKPNQERSYEKEAYRFAEINSPKYEVRFKEILKSHFKIERRLYMRRKVGEKIYEEYIVEFIPKV